MRALSSFFRENPCCFRPGTEVAAENIKFSVQADGCKGGNGNCSVLAKQIRLSLIILVQASLNRKQDYFSQFKIRHICWQLNILNAPRNSAVKPEHKPIFMDFDGAILL